MSLAFGFALPHWQAISGGFSPQSLFAGGVNGIWVDPSDLTTMFTTSAGTTPVAMPGQGSAVSVGLMLDKSKGLVLGPELVTTPYSGSVSGSWLISATSVTRNSSAGGQASLSLSATIDTTKRYLVSFTVANLSGDTFFYRLGGGGTAYQITANGTYTVRVLGGAAASSLIFAPWAGGAGEATITNISVRELPGNHAIAFNNTTARPELRARVNLLTYSEEFDNGAWVKTAASVGINAATAPDGTLTADALIEDATNARHAIYQNTSLSLVTPFVASVYVKANTRTYALFGVGNSRFTRCIVNLSTGVAGALIGSEAANLIATVSSVGNGWWRVVIAGAFSTADSGFLWVGASDGSEIYTGDGTSGIYIWGTDLRPANIGANVPAYQRIADANTYDTNGFPLYLLFDGIDDGMYTPANLDLSNTAQATVFAGVRKNATVTQFPVGFSLSDANNGIFAVGADSGGFEYFFNSRGTTLQQVEIDNAAYNAPVSNVVTLSADIAAPSLIARINATQVGSNTSSQGTGNYGTYPLYIGSRNNGAFFFNGHLHGLIVVGSAVSAGNISATESWMAGKTGIQI